MRSILLVLLGISFAMPVTASQFVHGYVRKNGTYVSPHMRSTPNTTKYDNYSSHGNTNPYTGKKGYRSNTYIPKYHAPRKTHRYHNPYRLKKYK